MHDWKTLNRAVIDEFRANRGVVERFGGLPVIIVHTVGAKSGAVREIPLIPVFEDGEMLLFGTAGGSPRNPAWVFNLLAHPRVTVEEGRDVYEADIAPLPEQQAQAILRRRAESTPLLAEYLDNAAPRVVPVFRVARFDGRAG